MRTLPADYLAAARAAGRYPNIKAVISNVGTITGNDAIIECHIMKGDSAKPAYFETALALSSECRMTIDRRRINNEALIVSGTKIVVYAAFDNASGSEIASAKLGTYYITSYDKNDVVSGIITASDRMLYTGVDFNPEVYGQYDYPISISEMLTEAFHQSGMDNVALTLDIDPNVYSAIYKSETPKAEGMQGNPYTCRDVIARIAGMNLGALYLDADEVPQIYKYDTGSINDANILDIRVGSETFYIQQVLVYKSEERMAKKGSGYRQLPYAPRFDDMDFIDEGTPWVNQIIAASAKIRNKPWTTATVTIQGVGQIELGDFITVAGTTILVTGISYDFVNAHFTETLYSYAYTEEEYFMAPQKTVDVSTGTTKKPGVGEKIPESYEQTAERFNDYDDYNIAQTTGGNFSIMPYDHVEGFRNHAVGGGSITNDYLNASGGNSIKGQHNMLTQCLCCDVSGEDNTVSYDKHSRISGKENTDTSAGNLDGNNDVSGKNNTLSNSEETLVCGDGNSVSRGYCSIMFGTGNTATFGNLNPAQVFASIIGGNINQVHGIIASMVLGQNNDINDLVNSLVLGDGHTTSGRGTIDGGIVLGNGVVATSIPSGRSAYIIVGANSTLVGNTFRVDIDGWVDAARFIPQGADYAEYFEWADGNPENEDRRGLLVALDGDKIVPANGNGFFGVISAEPSVVGNSASLGWQGKFKRDVFGSIIKDKDGKPLLSDDYDPETEYIPREVRPEWAPVGLVGRLAVIDDGSCKTGGYCTARNGIAAYSKGATRARVLRRIDDTHVEVLVK